MSTEVPPSTARRPEGDGRLAATIQTAPRRPSQSAVIPADDNLTALHGERDHITDELAARPSLPPLLQHRLRRRHDKITRFLARHRPETT